MLNYKSRKILSLLLILTSFLIVNSCSTSVEKSKPDNSKQAINIVALKGPTSLGIVKLWDDSQKNNTDTKYNISMVGDPSEAVAKIANKDMDIALIPTNMASILYNKTSGQIKTAAINTLGVLYLVTNGQVINSISDLKNQTIFVSGQGATPEYVLKYILEKNGLTPEEDVFLEFKAEHSELASQLISGDISIGLLPEPFVTQVLSKNSDVKVALDLTKEWNKATEGSLLTMGVIVVRKEFLDKNKDAFDKFLNAYKDSVNYVNENNKTASQLADDYGIMQKEVAISAIPKCNVAFIEGKEMKEKIQSFLKILYDFDSKSVGGKLPNEDFYYQK